MSEIKALEKLRNTIVTYAADCDERWMLAACDDIEAEITERYMLLPVDADGVPIHLYDKLLKSTGAAKPTYDVVVGISDDSVFFIAKQGWESNWSKLTRHVKPRTLEDVIEGAINAAFGNEAPFSAIAKKAADEIRELLLGGDAE